MSTPSAPEPPSLDDMLNLGILIESLAPYHDLPMTASISSLLRDNNGTVPYSIASVLSARGVEDPNATVHALHEYLSALPTGQSLERKNITAFIVMTSLCFAMVSVRMYVRKFLTRRIRAEEWWCVAGFCGAICACALFILSHTRSYGAGQHVWDVSYNSLRRFAMILYPLETVFNTAFWPIKISFLVFYHSLSPQLLYNRAVLFVGIFITAWILTGDCLVFFQCRPLDYWNDLVGAKCFDRDRYFTAWGAVNVLTDFAVLLLPVPVVLGLQLKKREKAAVLSIFATGAFICIVSINRLITLRTWLQHADQTYLFAKTALWSLMEIDLALIISCVPALKVLLVKESRLPSSVISRMTQSGIVHRPSVFAWPRKESVSNGTASVAENHNNNNNTINNPAPPSSPPNNLNSNHRGNLSPGLLELPSNLNGGGSVRGGSSVRSGLRGHQHSLSPTTAALIRDGIISDSVSLVEVQYPAMSRARSAATSRTDDDDDYFDLDLERGGRGFASDREVESPGSYAHREPARQSI